MKRGFLLLSVALTGVESGCSHLQHDAILPRRTDSWITVAGTGHYASTSGNTMVGREGTLVCGGLLHSPKGRKHIQWEYVGIRNNKDAYRVRIWTDEQNLLAEETVIYDGGRQVIYKDGDCAVIITDHI